MTTNTNTPTYTAQQRSLIKSLTVLSRKIAKADADVTRLRELRQEVLVEAYAAGLDTVQLGAIIGTSAETVRKNLQRLGSLRGT